jgi:hypothetical protein
MTAEKKTSALLITGTLTMIPPETTLPPKKMVFQRVKLGLGNLPDKSNTGHQLRTHVIPIDPKTAAQIARRDLMRAAVARYRTPIGDDLIRWKKIARARNIPLFNAACSDILRNYTLQNGNLVPNP